MKYLGITPVDRFNGVFVKREDLAHFTSLEYPSGSKVRQYMHMAMPTDINGKVAFGGHTPFISPPCIVGCSANSAMQIYVAAAAKQLNTKGIIYTAQRKVKSEATLYAEMMGAEINLVKPGYLSVIKKQARSRIMQLGEVVQWNRKAAIQDTIDQCANIPSEVKRIIVPTGSGLTAAGVLIGVSKKVPRPMVIAVAVSPMATKESIWALTRFIDRPNSKYFGFIQPTSPYDTPAIAQLPDGTPLDPLYSAKAWQFMSPDDCLWPPGLRPVCAMPEECKQAFKDWKGPQ